MTKEQFNAEVEKVTERVGLMVSHMIQYAPMHGPRISDYDAASRANRIVNVKQLEDVRYEVREIAGDVARLAGSLDLAPSEAVQR